MTAAAALALIAVQQNAEGYEVIIPNRITTSQLHRVRQLSQVLGWRYYPGAHGKRPCGCPVCQRGEYGARRLREAYEKS